MDACPGDDGGPLACLLSDGLTYALAGVLSWGTPCGSGLPAVYTDVGYFLDFLTGVPLPDFDCFSARRHLASEFISKFIIYFPNNDTA